MAVNWGVVIGAAALALQTVATVGIVVASNTDTQTRLGVMSESISQIKVNQADNSRKVDFLYEKFVDRGFGNTFQRGE